VDEAQIEVTVGTRRYRLRGSDPELLGALAAQVDETLGAIAGPGGNKDDFRVAVLAALNLAGEHEDQRAVWHAAARRIAGEARDAEAALARLSAAL
jgi:cell division protein ZapA (FtsZ GTPase activity inhibitor)